MSKKRFGSHTQDQLAGEIPDLRAQIEQAEAELGRARENVLQADAKVVAARETLRAALGAYVRTFPPDVQDGLAHALAEARSERQLDPHDLLAGLPGYAQASVMQGAERVGDSGQDVLTPHD